MTHNITQTYQERILKVLIFIQNHLDDALSLEELASIAYFSPYHFHRIFTAHTGESIKSYVRRLRLERATRDLVFTDLPIVHISERAGYDTQQSFHRAFKEVYQQTPKTFRQHHMKAFSHLLEKQPQKIGIESIQVIKIDPIVVAFARHVGPYEEFIQAWFQLIAEVGMQHILSEKTRKISIPYDTPETTPSDKLRYDACVTLEELPHFKPRGQVGIQTIPGGKHAVITHYGSLEKIETSYQTLFGLWLPQSGYEPADHPNFMLHRTIPFETPEELLVTDIYLPLK